MKDSTTKGTKEKDLRPLPEGWGRTTLGEATNPAQKRVNPKNFPDLQYIGMENVEPQTMRLLGTVPASEMRSAADSFSPGDVLYGRLRPYLNKVVSPDFSGLCSTEFIIFRKVPHIHSKYLQYFLNSWDFVKFANSLNAGDRPRVKFEQLANYPFPLPPLPEQERIVARLEELLSDLEAGVAALERVRAGVKRYKASVLKAACEGKLFGDKEIVNGELPEGWRWVKVSDIGEIVTGTTPSKANPEYFSNDYPFYKPTDLDAGFYTRESRDGLSSQGIQKARLLPAMSVLVTCIGATIGKTGIIRVAGASNQQINAVIPNDSIVPEYLYFVCISPQFQKSIQDNASATTLPILNKGKFEELSIPLPPLEEQRRIVSNVERRLESARAVESAVEAGLKRAARLRQSVLKHAFEGKL